MLRSLSVLALVLALLVACGPGKGKFRFTVDIKKLQNAELLICPIDYAITAPDTMRISDGRMDYTGTMSTDEPQLVRISFMNTEVSLLAIAESNATLRLEGEATQLARLRVLGSEQNQLLTDFRLSVVDKTKRDQQMAAAEFIRKHIDQMVAVAAFVQYFAEQTEVSTQLAMSVARELREAHKAQAWVAQLTQTLEAQWRSGKGERLPQFSLTARGGRVVTNADFAGKPFAIVVWASWNNKQPSYATTLRQAVPQLAQLHISLDTDSAMARGIILRDSITAPVIMERRGLASPTVRLFGIHQVPTCILVDASGRIVGREVSVEHISTQAQKLFQ